MSLPIDISQALFALIDFEQELLYQHFNAEKDALWSVSVDGDGNKFTSNGIYLPDVDLVKREANPELAFRVMATRPTLYVGPAGGIQNQSDQFYLTATGNVYNAQQPMACAVVFPFAPQVAPNAPGAPVATELDLREIMVTRAAMYYGAISHTITKYTTQRAEALQATPSGFAAPQVLEFPDIDSDQDDAQPRLVGSALFSFDVLQLVSTPTPISP